ncbi:MAG TPA: hypothetical protein DD671_14790 [Balneolaceae bacterium]|nr:hypothetical protein [Balneola sp.]HBQ60841.1 hypothetical protein [Balneolaceae bacterium]|tara:strand:+ start:2003 stop:2686 length:684 start_codon:yes stop_codon:yes gene_type:complete
MNAQSGYINSGLGQLNLSSNIISSEAVELRIIGRNPASGNPKSGVPFSLDLEIETFRNWPKVLFVPFMTNWGQCPDALVVVRSGQTGSVLGFQRFNTAMMDNCRAQERLIFDRSFVPTSGHKVIFEVYPDDVDLHKLSPTDLIEKSAPISLDLDQQTGQQSGVYSPPTESWYKMPDFNPGSTLSNVNTFLKRVLILGGISAGLIYIAPILPGLRAGIKAIAPKGAKK